MQADRFTIKSQEALQAALRLAPERGHTQVTPEHLLAVLLEQADGVVAPVLGKLGVAAASLRERVNAALEALPTITGEPQEPATSPELLAVLRAGEQEMSALGDEYVSTEHLLLALTEAKTPAGDALRAAGASHDAV